MPLGEAKTIMCHCKRNILLTVLVILLSGFTVQLDALENDGNNLYVINTEFFDFIYKEKSETTALILAEKADGLYRKAASLLCTETNLHLPVYIISDIQQLNGYFTNSPYNQIGIYDTPCDIDDLAVFSETIVSDFYHELIHAITINMKSNTSEAISKVMGDFFSPAMLMHSTLSTLEGATVSFESMDGEGRLNNGDSMAYLVQAKLEDKFPSWIEASGVRDVFPSGPYPYYFGGAFSDFIQKKYGMEKYSEFWKECGKISLKLVEDIYRDVYGKKIDEDWEAFRNSVPVPALCLDSEVTGILNRPSYSKCMAVRQGERKGVVFLKDNSYVMYAGTGDDGKLEEPVTLFSGDSSFKNLSFTEDGRYLFVISLDTLNSGKYCLRIYDMRQADFLSCRLPETVQAAVQKGSDGVEYLVTVAVHDGETYREIRRFQDILLEGEKAELLFSEKYNRYSENYGLISTPESLVSLQKDSGTWKLYLDSVSEGYFKDHREYCLPEGMVPSSISFSGSHQGKTYISLSVAGKGLLAGDETSPGSLSRLLLLEVDEASGNIHASLQKQDVSGGLHDVCYDPVSDGLFFISRKAESQDPSLCSGVPGGLRTLADLEERDSSGRSDENVPLVTRYSSQDRKPYNKYSSLLQGMLLPVGVNLFTDDVSLGVTYVSMDITQSCQLIVSAGMDPFSGKGSAGISFSTGLFGITIAPEWNSNGFDKFRMFLNAGLEMPFRTENEYLYVGGASGVLLCPDKTSGLNNTLKAGYGMNYRTGMEYYSRLGFSAYMTLDNSINWSRNEALHGYLNIGLQLSARLPKVLPLENYGRHTFNMPLSVSAALMADQNNFLSLGAETVLYSYEFQKEVPYADLYCNRFSWTAGILSSWGYSSPEDLAVFNLFGHFKNMGTMKNITGISTGLNFTVTLPLSSLSSFSFKLGADYTRFVNNTVDDREYEVTICGMFTF